MCLKLEFCKVKKELILPAAYTVYSEYRNAICIPIPLHFMWDRFLCKKLNLKILHLLYYRTKLKTINRIYFFLNYRKANCLTLKPSVKVFLILKCVLLFWCLFSFVPEGWLSIMSLLTSPNLNDFWDFEIFFLPYKRWCLVAIHHYLWICLSRLTILLNLAPCHIESKIQ